MKLKFGLICVKIGLFRIKFHLREVKFPSLLTGVGKAGLKIGEIIVKIDTLLWNFKKRRGAVTVTRPGEGLCYFTGAVTAAGSVGVIPVVVSVSSGLSLYVPRLKWNARSFKIFSVPSAPCCDASLTAL